MKIISGNVNGIRAGMKKDGVGDFLESENPDVFCIQETKAQKDQVEEFLEKEKKDFLAQKKDAHDIAFFGNHPYHYGNSAQKKGYSGTAIFSKKEPLSVEYGIGDELDSEGRVITVEFEKYYLITVYTPNSKPDLARVDYRKDVGDKNFLKHMKKLEEKKPVISCGDFNVAYAPIDLKNPTSNRTTEKRPGTNGFTDKERDSFGEYFKAGFIDTFRCLYPEKIQYSGGSYRFNARKNNSGGRIDYFLISESLKKDLKKAIVYDQAHGSDHCPVGIMI